MGRITIDTRDVRSLGRLLEGTAQDLNRTTKRVRDRHSEIQLNTERDPRVGQIKPGVNQVEDQLNKASREYNRLSEIAIRTAGEFEAADQVGPLPTPGGWSLPRIELPSWLPFTGGVPALPGHSCEWPAVAAEESGGWRDWFGDRLRDGNNALDRVRGGLNRFTGTVTGVCRRFVRGARGLLGRATSWASRAKDAVGDTVGGVRDSVSDGWNWARGGLTSAFNWGKDKLKTLITETWNAIWDGLTSTLKTAIDGIKTLAKVATWTKTKIDQFENQLRRWQSKTFETFSDVFGNLVDLGHDALVGLSKLDRYTREVLGDATDAVASAANHFFGRDIFDQDEWLSFLETSVDGINEIRSLTPLTPQNLYTALTDPMELAERYKSYGFGLWEGTKGVATFAYDFSSVMPGSPAFIVELYRWSGSGEHRGVTLVTGLGKVGQSVSSLHPLSPDFVPELMDVISTGSIAEHDGLNSATALVVGIVDWETFKDDPSKWAGKMTIEGLVEFATGTVPVGAADNVGRAVTIVDRVRTIDTGAKAAAKTHEPAKAKTSEQIDKPALESETDSLKEE